MPAPLCLPSDLVLLREEIKKLPVADRDRLLPLFDRLVKYLRLHERLLKIAQDAVDNLQLDITYLQFDLEATYRERNELFNQLYGDNQNNSDDLFP